MHSCVKKQEKENNKYIIFGDIHLKDIRNYRMEKMKEANVECIFPIFDDNINNHKLQKLGESIIKSGIKALIICIDLNKLDKSFIGREYDLSLIDELKSLNVDICGENGEFHTFVYKHPMFKKDIKIKKGEIKINDNLCFIDIILDKNES